MTQGSPERPQAEWQRKTNEYARAINAYIEKGMLEGWDNVGEQPKSSGREHLIADLHKALKHNNELNNTKSISHLWPPAHAPLVSDIIEQKGQSIPIIALLDDGSIIARIGTCYQDGHVVQITPDKIHKIPDISYFGQGPNKRYFAITKEDGVSVTDGWLGPETAFCPWPTGLEDIPKGYNVQKFGDKLQVDRLIPFPDGSAVLVISNESIYALTPKVARRLLPSIAAQKEYYDYLKKEDSDEPLSMSLDMSHGNISHNGKMIAVGSQDGDHLVYNSKFEIIAEIGPISSYPHYAAFSKDDTMLALNSCHFYNGITFGVPTDLFNTYKTEAYEMAPDHIELNDQDRVYAATSTSNLFITGDAYGYIRGFDKTGKDVFRIFLGSSIGDIDVSKDEKTLIVSTYAGFIAKYDLEADSKAAYQIGTGNVLELQRWAFWKDTKPFLW